MRDVVPPDAWSLGGHSLETALRSLWTTRVVTLLYALVYTQLLERESAFKSHLKALAKDAACKEFERCLGARLRHPAEETRGGGEHFVARVRVPLIAQKLGQMPP